MLPYIYFGSFGLKTAYILYPLAFILFSGITYIKAKKTKSEYNEVKYIFSRLVPLTVFVFFGAVIYHTVFDLLINGNLVFMTGSFYGGLLTAIFSFGFIYKKTPKSTCLSKNEWLDLLCIPFAVSHIACRINCFLSGCCLGTETNLFFGVVFPDSNQKVHPTQIYEIIAVAIIILLTETLFKKHKGKAYLVLYSVFRFFVEFIRADRYDLMILDLSVSQLTSVLIIAVIITMYIQGKVKQRILH